MVITVAALVVAGLLAVAAAFVENRDREPTRQSWTGGRTTLDWPSKGLELLSAGAFVVGAWDLVDRDRWVTVLLCLGVFVPGAVVSVLLARRRAHRQPRER